MKNYMTVHFSFLQMVGFLVPPKAKPSESKVVLDEILRSRRAVIFIPVFASGGQFPASMLSPPDIMFKIPPHLYPFSDSWSSADAYVSCF